MATIENVLTRNVNNASRLEEAPSANETQRKASQETAGQFESLLREISKLKLDADTFQNTSTALDSSNVHVLSVANGKIVIEVNLNNTAANTVPDTPNHDCHPDPFTDSETEDMDFNPNHEKSINYLKNSSDAPCTTSGSEADKPVDDEDFQFLRQTRVRRAISECHEDVQPRRGILKSRSTDRRTMSESNAEGYESDDNETHSNSDASLGSDGDSGCEKPKKTVHFNEHIFMTTFRSQSSILGRKKKNQRRALRRQNSKEMVKER